MRSPAALVASLACLASAAVLAGLLVQEPAEPSLRSAHTGDELVVEGALAPMDEPEAWQQVRDSLWGSTYELVVDGVDDIVLLTGMEPGLEHRLITSEVVVLLQTPHANQDVDIIVLAPLR